jgi:predicted MFS family arabinose efflux permease
VLVLALACGLCVANLYYIQPILPVMAAALHHTPQSLTPAVSSTQLGYAVGLLTLVPLGDAVDRRRLLTVLMTATAVVLAVIPFAAPPMLFWLFFLLGLVTVSAMVIVPHAADMALPEYRGQVVGTVMTGLILGTLLCRTFAGALAEFVSWKAVYWSAAVLMVLCCLMLRRVLPSRSAAEPVTWRGYLSLMGSLGSLARRSPVLVERALYGALGFASFNVFWTALPLRLGQGPYHYGSAVIGSLGLLGAAGALGASLAGRLADRGRQTAVTAAAFAVIAVTFTGVGAHSASLLVFAAAILLIDFAVQGAHITNQATAFANTDAGMRSRVTTVYMTTYFAGGAAGSAAVGLVWPHGGWPAVTRIGTGTSLCALLLLGCAVAHRRHRSTSTAERKK